MKKDRLILVEPGFGDPDYPGQTFFCWHCALMEGVMSSFPQLRERIEVQRIAWPKPRQELVDLIGPDRQWLPVMILAEDTPAGLETGQHGSVRFVEGKDEILKVMATRHEVPVPHP